MTAPTEFVLHPDRLTNALRGYGHAYGDWVGPDDDKDLDCVGERGGSKLEWLATVLAGRDGEIEPFKDLDAGHAYDNVVRPDEDGNFELWDGTVGNPGCDDCVSAGATVRVGARYLCDLAYAKQRDELVGPFVDCPYGLTLIVYEIFTEYDDVVVVSIRPKEYIGNEDSIQIATYSLDSKDFGDLTESGIDNILEAAESIVRIANSMVPSAVKLWGL